MDITPLVAKLREPSYVTMTDAQAEAAINAITVVVRRPVTCAAVKAHSIKNGYWAKIDIGCESSTTTTRTLCRNARAWIEDSAGKLETVDMDSPVTVAMLDQLVALQMMTAAQRASLADLANKTIQWTEFVGVHPVGIGLISNARKVIAMETVSAQ